ncbi:hypothetical protein ALCH109712_12895 [Alkalicoccus chagannorensis]
MRCSGRNKERFLPSKSLQRFRTPFRSKGALRFCSSIGIYKFSYKKTTASCAAREERSTCSSLQNLRYTPFRPKGALRFCSSIEMYKFSYSVTAAPCAAREETKNVFFPQKDCSASARRSERKALCAFVPFRWKERRGHGRRSLPENAGSSSSHRSRADLS